MDNPKPAYLNINGINYPYGEPPADALSVDMALQGIEAASMEVRCDHGTPITDFCESCKAHHAI